MASEKRPPPEITWLTSKEILTPLPEVSPLIAGLDIVPGRPTVFASFGSGGKTLCMQSLTLALASGRDIWDIFPVDSPKRVGHIDKDQGHRATLTRYQRLARGMGLTHTDLGDRLLVTTMPKINLVRASDEELLVKIIVELKLDLLWLDAYRRLIPGADENDSRAAAGLEMCTRASERTGCPIVMLAHSGKSDSGGTDHAMRGSSSLFDSSGAIYKFTGKRIKRMSHMRPSALHEGPPQGTIELEIAGEPGGPLTVRGVTAGLSKPAQRLAEALTDTPSGSRELGRQTHLTSGSARAEALEELYRAGIAKKVGQLWARAGAPMTTKKVDPLGVGQTSQKPASTRFDPVTQVVEKPQLKLVKPVLTRPSRVLGVSPKGDAEGDIPEERKE